MGGHRPWYSPQQSKFHIRYMTDRKKSANDVRFAKKQVLCGTFYLPCIETDTNIIQNSEAQYEDDYDPKRYFFALLLRF